ncbi:hypothetical protein JSE7799_02290 [Jannaschia seosinensis]|uniref:Uncharacterized protein n=1 Tax=Jannaschia seosinensis TaxID=313367 RepID=A0A0M7BCD3_9RHOB|nr:hypothetical protein [Jannaschia seosinensis]CUH39563.1 hypothetical protein JSE7799_02290 [Jannaschia seosinensis]
MQTFSQKREWHSLNRMAALSGIVLIGIVVFDLVGYKYYGGFDEFGVTTATAAD